MSRALWFCAGIALGATAIVLLDRVHERRGRTMLRGQVTPHADQPAPSDDLLVLRVRAALGHFTSHPKSIHVAAARGRVTLRGAVLAGERADLVATARRVDGVNAVDDLLTTYLDATGVPELQGGARARED